jgi:hypothetical protein
MLVLHVRWHLGPYIIQFDGTWLPKQSLDVLGPACKRELPPANSTIPEEMS